MNSKAKLYRFNYDPDYRRIQDLVDGFFEVIPLTISKFRGRRASKKNNKIANRIERDGDDTILFPIPQTRKFLYVLENAEKNCAISVNDEATSLCGFTIYGNAVLVTLHADDEDAKDDLYEAHMTNHFFSEC